MSISSNRSDNKKNKNEESGGPGSKSAFSTYHKPMKQSSFSGTTHGLMGSHIIDVRDPTPAKRTQSVGSVLRYFYNLLTFMCFYKSYKF